MHALRVRSLCSPGAAWRRALTTRRGACAAMMRRRSASQLRLPFSTAWVGSTGFEGSWGWGPLVAVAVHRRTHSQLSLNRSHTSVEQPRKVLPKAWPVRARACAALAPAGA